MDRRRTKVRRADGEGHEVETIDANVVGAIASTSNLALFRKSKAVENP